MLRTVFGIIRSLPIIMLIALAAAPYSNASAIERPGGYYEQIDSESRMAMQDLLVWSGDYHGPIDGLMGLNSQKAVADFQRRNARTADGLLTREEIDILVEEAGAIREAAEWTMGTDDRAGIAFGLPYTAAMYDDENGSGNLYRSDASDFRVITFRLDIDNMEQGLEIVRDLWNEVEGYRGEPVRSGADWITASGADATETMRLRALVRDGEMRGLFVWYDTAKSKPFTTYANATVNSLSWGAVLEEEDAPAVASAESGDASIEPVAVERKMDRERGPTGSGSGFFVRADGVLITNAHVVDGCGHITVGRYGRATVLKVDDRRDLAILELPGVEDAPIAQLAGERPQLAQTIYAFGFPMPEDLGGELGFSSGHISSTVGLNADRSRFRMTAPVQPGNSGGPLLDSEGAVVGIVTSKLNAMRVASLTGDIPQSMNFAVRATELSALLEEAGMTVATRAATGETRQAVQLAQEAKGYTQQVSCWQ